MTVLYNRQIFFFQSLSGLEIRFKMPSLTAYSKTSSVFIESGKNNFITQLWTSANLIHLWTKMHSEYVSNLFIFEGSLMCYTSKVLKCDINCLFIKLRLCKDENFQFFLSDLCMYLWWIYVKWSQNFIAIKVGVFLCLSHYSQILRCLTLAPNFGVSHIRPIHYIIIM